MTEIIHAEEARDLALRLDPISEFNKLITQAINNYKNFVWLPVHIFNKEEILNIIKKSGYEVDTSSLSRHDYFIISW